MFTQTKSSEMIATIESSPYDKSTAQSDMVHCANRRRSVPPICHRAMNRAEPVRPAAPLRLSAWTNSMADASQKLFRWLKLRVAPYTVAARPNHRTTN